MESVGPLLDILKERPDLFLTAFLVIIWWLERTERRTQQKVNSELQTKMLDQISETKSALTEIRALLQILTRGRH